MLGCFLALQITKFPLCTDPQWRQARNLPSSLETLLVARWAKVTQKAGALYEFQIANLQELFSYTSFRGFSQFHRCSSFTAVSFLSPGLLRTAVHTLWSEVSLWLVSVPAWEVACIECWPLRPTPRKVACVLHGSFCLAIEVVDKQLSLDSQGNTQRQNGGH